MLQYSTLLHKTKLKSDYLGEDIYNLLDKTFELPADYAFNIFETTEEYVARPDLISLDAYGDTMFADVICKLNGISNPFELNVGTKLIIPSPENILDFVHKPDINDIESNKANKKPIAKTKQQKRKANQAIVGDKRFKIDQQAGIIIY